MDYGQPVRFGVFVIPEATERPLQLAAVADELGFDVVGVQDHPYQRRFYDTWTLLTAIAMRTDQITVFPDVANVPLRPPAMLAKAAATIGIWLGAYKPRMLSLVGRLADGWVPSYGYVKEPDLLEGNRRIDEAAVAAGRDPRSIRRVLNAGLLDAATLVSLVVDYGMDTFLVTDDPDEMRSFASEVAPRVREEVESRRSSRAD